MLSMKTTGFFVILLLLLPLTACRADGAAEPVSTQFLAMDTVMSLTVYGRKAQSAAALGEECVRELEALFSVTAEGSDIYRANHAVGRPVELSGDTRQLLTDALEICGATGGVLDVTIYPVVRAWGFTTGEYRIPQDGELSALLEQVDYRRIVLEDGKLTVPEGMELDLGSVAKGYTGDRLMEVFQDAGVKSAIVELGGNVQTLGSKPDGTPWRIAVQSPNDGGYAGVLEVVDKAVVTSGGYQRYFERDGETYWHIMDPATGRPARSGAISVTIVADRGVEADGLSTALFVMGSEKAAAYWREHPGFDYIIIGGDGRVTITEGLETNFSLYGGWTENPLEVIRQ